MKLEIRSDKVIIEGYVNAICRNSKPLWSALGRFVERIMPNAFKNALIRNDDVKILLNHDWKRVLGSTKQGNLELYEDNIGLHARAEITDTEVVNKARNGDLVGWSFGFTDRDVESSNEKGMPLREVKELDLFEVSILDRTKTPAYDGTLIEARDEGKIVQFRSEIEENPEVKEVVEEQQEEKVEEVVETTPETIEEVPKQQNVVENISENVDYSAYDDAIKSMKGA